jgi:hypothetical protein
MDLLLVDELDDIFAIVFVFVDHYTGSLYVLHALQNQEILMLFIHRENVFYMSRQSSSLMMGPNQHNNEGRRLALVVCKSVNPILCIESIAFSKFVFTLTV